MSNTLLLNSHIGLGVYLYSRRHMEVASRPWRMAYAVCGSVLFNMGTVMVCAVTKVLLPHIDAVRTVFGVTTGIAFLTIARRYLQFIDDSIITTS